MVTIEYANRDECEFMIAQLNAMKIEFNVQMIGLIAVITYQKN